MARRYDMAQSVRGADLHMVQLMPLPLTVSCFSKIHIGFTFLVQAHLGGPGQMAINGCVCGISQISTVTTTDTQHLHQQNEPD